MSPRQTASRVNPHVLAAAPGLVIVGLMLVWAVHDGGYDAETWYWGGLVALALLAGTLVLLGVRRTPLPLLAAGGLGLFALYVAWSYLSISWAQAPGVALEGSNRALLYLLVFAVVLVVPWTSRSALAALTVFAVGVGTIGIALVVRLASQDRIPALFVENRLAAPTGYFNANAALFTMGALVCLGLAVRRELPGLLRGLLLMLACADLQLAVLAQSRGWLFTLPLVVVMAVAVCGDRLRFVAAAALPVAGFALPLADLLEVYRGAHHPGLATAAIGRAGHAGLLACAAVFVAGTVLAWADSLRGPAPIRPRRRRLAGAALAVVVIGVGLGAAEAATHGHPGRFLARQLNGFDRPQHGYTASHFGDVGSGRYDFWRVALDAALVHPIGGLGQDNFADYYVRRRHTSEEPSWTHSLELRLLAHTGFVGLVLFAGVLICGLTLALRGRGTREPAIRAVSGVAVLPLVVWMVHGSVDWFWEFPALSGPALGFLALAGSLSLNAACDDDRGDGTPAERRSDRPARRLATRVVGTGVAAAMVVALGPLTLGYLSAREVSLASDARATDPGLALRDLAQAAKLDPLTALPGRLGGTIALQNGAFRTAERSFDQAIAREPGGWFPWLGRGLASSGLGLRASAERDFRVAQRINSRQKVVRIALRRLGTAHPLTVGEAFRLITLAQ